MDANEVISPKPNIQEERTTGYRHGSRMRSFTIDGVTEQHHHTELSAKNAPRLAISASNEPICTDAQPTLDPKSINRFCRIWAEVGRAILARRSKVTA
jgi:hypothetical protein